MQVSQKTSNSTLLTANFNGAPHIRISDCVGTFEKENLLAGIKDS